MERVRLLLLRRRINAMLRRTVGPVHYEEAGKLPAYLLRDIESRRQCELRTDQQ